MPPVGFEPTISGGERPQTYALDCAATGTGIVSITYSKYRYAIDMRNYNFAIEHAEEVWKVLTRLYKNSFPK